MAANRELKPVGQIIIRWRGYDVDKALRTYSDAEITDIRLDRSKDLPFPPRNVDAFCEWMQDNEIKPFDAVRIGQETRPRWTGIYRVILGQLTQTS